MPSHAYPTAHGWCLLWDWPLIITTIVSDSMIAFAYFAIPVAVYLFMRRFRAIDPLVRRALVSLVLFVTSCGLTHVMDVVVIWYPYYWLNAWTRVLTAIASVATVIFIYPALTLFVMGEEHHREHTWIERNVLKRSPLARTRKTDSCENSTGE